MKKIVPLILLGGFALFLTRLPSAAPQRAAEKTQEASLPENGKAVFPLAPKTTEMAIEKPPAVAILEKAQSTEVQTITPNQRQWAAARRERMQKLIRENPELALAEALSPRERAALPPALAAMIEQPVSGKGSYAVLAVCSHGADEGHGQGCKIEREVMINGTPYRAHVYGRRQEQLTTEEDSLFGVAVDGEIALHEAPLIRWQPEQLPDALNTEAEVVVQYEGEMLRFETESEFADWQQDLETAALITENNLANGEVFDPASPPTGPAFPTIPYNEYSGRNSHQLGPKTLMVMVVKPSDGESFGASPPTFTTLDSQMDNLSQWYYNNSYKQTWFGPKEQADGTVVDRLVVTVELDLPNTVDYYYYSQANTGGFSRLQTDTLAAVRAQGGDFASGGKYDYQRFDRWVVMSKTKLVSSTGLASVGGRFSWSGYSLDSSVAYHELGHNWGVFHANYWEGDNGITRNASGTHTEYGDGADVMGGGGANDFNPLFKERLGFLYTPDGDIIEATSSGSYRVFDHTEPEADKAATRARALKIPVTGTSSSSKYLMFSLRHHGGTDGQLGRSSWNRNALELHSDQVSSSGDNSGSHFLDTSPGSRTDDGEDKADGGLMVGRTYSEPADLNGTSLYGEIHVTPVGRGSLSDGGTDHEYMDVVVNLGDFSGNQAPIAAFTASATEVDTGVQVTFTSTSTDPDGDTLAYAWTFGDDRYSYDNQSVQTITWSSPGLYEVILTVSDMKGGTDSSSVWINVGSIPSIPAVTPGPTVAGVHYQYYEGTFTAVPDYLQLIPVSQGTLGTPNLSPKQQGDNFAFLYEGFLNVPADEVITFFLNVEDGAKLYVGGQLVIDNSNIKTASEEKFGNILLDAGTHPFRLEYFHSTGNELLSLQWKATTATGNQRQSLPTSVFTQVDSSQNSAPTVALTAPVSDEVFTLGNPISLTATASDSDGIERVVFFAGNTYISEDLTAPYTATFNNAPIGSYELSAVAYDQAGLWTQSAVIPVSVEASEQRNMVSLNFVAEAPASDAALAATDEVGAEFPGANWNNVDSDDKKGVNGTVTNLHDHTGTATPVAVTWYSASHENHVDSISSADFSTPPGKMMRGMITSRDFDASFDITGIPYAEYDVYVYYESIENQTPSAQVATVKLTPGGQAVQNRYIKSSLTAGDGVGAYPAYDTWTGFKASTATSASAPNAEILGNYVVFRGLTQPTFLLELVAPNRSGIPGIQIVEAPASNERLQLVESNFSTEVTEAGGSDSFDLSLSLPPTNGATITVDLTPDAQITVNPTQLTFTDADFDSPQTVTVQAVDDANRESSPHSGTIQFTVSSSVNSNYDGLTPPDLNVAVTDDDLPTINLSTIQQASESGPVSGIFRVTRSGISSLTSPQTVDFTLSGSATAGADYVVSGADSFNNGSGSGSITIAAGQSTADLTIATLDDAEDEGAETVTMTLAAEPGQIEIASGSASLTVTDDEILLNESFNAFTAIGSGNNWANGSGDFNWSVNSGSTASSGTGPWSGDGNYLYTEASGSNSPGKTAIVLSPTVNLNNISDAELRFNVHMFGSDMGTLYVDFYSNGSWHEGVVTLSGNQQALQADDWIQVTQDLAGYLTSDFRIRFRGITGDGFSSDMAIDDVQVVSVAPDTPVAPVIQSHPQDQNLVTGETLTLSVSATGTPAPSYQWKKNTTDIPGAVNAVYTVGSVDSTHAGSYTVVVSNTEGSVTSNPATVSVTTANQAPAITLVSPVSAQVAIPSGTGLILDTTVTDDGEGGGPLTTLWTQVNGDGTASFDDSSLPDTGVTFDADGSYLLRLTANDGSLSSEFEVTVTVGAPTGYPPPPNPLLWYPLDEGSGNTATDAAGSNHGSISGSPSWTAGARDGALSVDLSGGSGQFEILSTSQAVAVANGSSWTASMWVRLDVTPGENVFLIQHTETGSGVGRSWLAVDNTRMLFTFMGGVRMDAAVLNLNQWHHVALVMDGSTFKIYIDGTEEASSPGSVEAATGEFLFGNFKNPTDGKQFDGQFDDIALYNRALTQNEVTAMVSVQNQGPAVDAGTLANGQPGQSSNTDATVSDDNLPAVPGTVSLAWQQISGPGTVSFGNSQTADTPVTADQAGSYLLRLLADDGEMVTFDEVAWTVNISGPAAPNQLAAWPLSGSQIQLDWNDQSAEETGFRVERATDPGGPWSLAANVAADTVTFTDTELTPAMYLYRVTALGSSADSAPTDPVLVSTLDTDNDGMLDEHELIAGTSPSDGNDVLKLQSAQPVSGGDVAMQVDTVSGVYYRVLYRDDLKSGNWQVLSGYSSHNGDGNPLFIEDSFTGSRFYRLEVRDIAWD